MKKIVTFTLICLLALFVFQASSATADFFLPDDLLEIKDGAFQNDTSLGAVTLPEHIEKIGAYAFAGSSVTKINLPPSLIDIAPNAFDGCSPELVFYVEMLSYAHRWCVEHNVKYFYPNAVYPVATITVGSYTVSINDEYPTALLCFEPESDGRYSIHSEGSDDCMVQLYDGDGFLLASDDNSGDADNFLLTYALDAGQTYVYKVNYTETAMQGDIHVKMSYGLPLRITRQPSDTAATAGDEAVISTKVLGEEITCIWQEKKAGSESWEDLSPSDSSATMGMSGLDTPDLHLYAQLSQNGNQYRCIITDKSGFTATSEAATLTVRIPELQLSRETQMAHLFGNSTRYCFTPELSGSYTICSIHPAEWDPYVRLFTPDGTCMAEDDNGAGEAFAFKLTAYLTAGIEYTYQIDDYYKKNRPDEWISILLTADEGPQFKSQPASAEVEHGQEAVFSVLAEGKAPLRYQWQEKYGTYVWQNTDLGDSTTDTLRFTSACWLSGRRFRCVVTDADGLTITSDEATLTVPFTDILAGSVTMTIPDGKSAVWYRFQPTATGQYLLRTELDQAPHVSLYDANGVPVQDEFRDCVLSGNSVYYLHVARGSETDSGTYRLYLYANEGVFFPKPDQVPTEFGATVQDEAMVTVEADGRDLSWQWQVRKDESADWEDYACNTNTLCLLATTEHDQKQFRCVITDYYGYTLVSNPIRLIVRIPELRTGLWTAVIHEPGTRMRYRFKPPVTGEYVLRSVDETELDPYVSVYRNGQQIFYDDFNGTGNNFRLIAQFEAGSVYEIDIGLLDGPKIDTPKTGSIPFSIYASSGPQISQQPADTWLTNGASGTLSVTASGVEPLSYLWEAKDENDLEWRELPDQKTSEISVIGAADVHHRLYRCTVIDANGLTYLSDEAMIRITTSNAPVYRALLIAEADYDYNVPLPETRIDVEKINQMLQSVLAPGEQPYHIYGGENEYVNSSPKEVFSLISKCLGDAKENDVSLFFISAHGNSSSSNASAGAIATVRASSGRKYWSGLYYYDASQAIFTAELAEALKKVPGKVIIWIDTCGSGAGVYSRGIESPTDPSDLAEQIIESFRNADEYLPEISDTQSILPRTGEYRVSNKFYVLTSSAYRQVSLTFPFMGGALPWAITSAIGTSGAMAADNNPADGTLTLNELYRYCYDFVLSNTAGQKVQVYPEKSNYPLFLR